MNYQTLQHANVAQNAESKKELEKKQCKKVWFVEKQNGCNIIDWRNGILKMTTKIDVVFGVRTNLTFLLLKPLN